MEKYLSASPGTLWLISTPIGNLEDMSPRAIRILRDSSLVLAEDTRVFQKLSESFSLGLRAQSFRDENERRETPRIIERLQNGDSVALTSDAGTPTVSDPGYRLVKAARKLGIPVSAVPGPSAAIMALSISGFETDCFWFEGFLPPKSQARQKRFLDLLQMDATIICYESPHRIEKSIQDLVNVAPDTEIFVCRELTKKFEDSRHGPAARVLLEFGKDFPAKGEFVLLLRRPSMTKREITDSLPSREFPFAE